MKKAPQAQAWRLSGKTFRPHTFTELQLEESSNGFKNVSFVDPTWGEHRDYSILTVGIIDIDILCRQEYCAGVSSALSSADVSLTHVSFT